MALSKQEIIHQHYMEVGRKGGQSKSHAKRKDIMENLEKALRKRWGKKFKLRKPNDRH